MCGRAPRLGAARAQSSGWNGTAEPRVGTLRCVIEAEWLAVRNERTSLSRGPGQPRQSTEVSGLLHALDALGEQVKRTLHRICQAHEQLIHLVDRRCEPGTSRSLC